MRSFFSNTVTQWPARASCCAAARPAGPEPTTATRLPVRAAGGSGRIQPCCERVVDDGLLDLLDGHRRLVDAQHAGGFARRRADAAGEFRKIVGRVQHANGFAPAAAIHQVVPVGNDVGERAAGVAEGHAAIHAAGALRAELVFGKVEIDLEPVVDALGDRTPLGQSRACIPGSRCLYPWATCRASIGRR